MQRSKNPPEKSRTFVESLGLDRDKRFRAPARRRKVIQAIAKQLGWKSRGNDTFFLFRDRSIITTDETGQLRSSGGKATKAFFKFQLWNIPLKARNPSNQGASTQRRLIQPATIRLPDQQNVR